MVVLLRLQEIKIMAKIIFKNIILEIAAYTLSRRWRLISFQKLLGASDPHLITGNCFGKALLRMEK